MPKLNENLVAALKWLLIAIVYRADAWLDVKLEGEGSGEVD
ncbi:hypothetical protein [Novosphingobium sp.]